MKFSNQLHHRNFPVLYKYYLGNFQIFKQSVSINNSNGRLCSLHHADQNHIATNYKDQEGLKRLAKGKYKKNSSDYQNELISRHFNKKMSNFTNESFRER